MQLPTTLMQQATVGDVVGERMLEGVLEIRIEPRLVEELGGLETIESRTQRVVGHFGDRLEQRERHVLAAHRRDLKEVLVLRRETVDASRQHRLDGGRDLDRM